MSESPHKQVLVDVAMKKFQIMNQGMKALAEDLKELPKEFNLQQGTSAYAAVEETRKRIEALIDQAREVRPSGGPPPRGVRGESVKPTAEEDFDSMMR